MAGAKKNCGKEGRTIVFVDESGLSERPHRCRTWAPRGQTPILQYHFSWKTLSMIAGMTVYRFYFRLYRGTIRTPQVLDFLRQLRRQIPGKLLIVWDGLAAHRSRKVLEYVESQQGDIRLERLPPYAPELNPVEYLWGHLKQHQLANLCPQNLLDLSTEARRALRRIWNKRSTLVVAFWKQAELF